MYDYDYLDIINFFKDIESSFPVESLEYRNIKIWPIIKVDFYYQLVLNENKEPQAATNTKKNIKQKLGDVILAWKNIQKIKAELEKEEQLYSNIKSVFSNKKKYKNVFITPSSFSKTNSANEIYNNQSEPFLNTLRDKDSTLVLEFQHANIENKSTGERNIDYLIQRSKIALKKRIFKNYIFSLLSLGEKNELSPLEEKLKVYLGNSGRKVMVDFEKIKIEIDSIICLKDEFTKLLENIKPDFVIYPVYINHESFAVTLAAKELNIKTIEMQHGVYSHPIYIYHQNTFNSEQGYELIPNYFFSWDKEQANLINTWSKKTKSHIAFAYGINPINYWRMNTKNNYQSSISKLEAILGRTDIIHVLFTISEYVDEKLATLIAATKNKCFWYIRNHPRASAFNQHLMQKLIAKLNEEQCDNYEIENSTNCFLYPLLEKMDYHLTISSSVACESIEMGITTIVIDSYGIILYKDLYEKNPNIYFSEDTSTILNYIDKKPTKKSLNNELNINYFEDFIIDKNL